MRLIIFLMQRRTYFSSAFITYFCQCLVKVLFLKDWFSLFFLLKGARLLTTSNKKLSAKMYLCISMTSSLCFQSRLSSIKVCYSLRLNPNIDLMNGAKNYSISNKLQFLKKVLCKDVFMQFNYLFLALLVKIVFNLGLLQSHIKP